MMKNLLLALAVLLPTQAISVEADSIYTWGAWAQGIKPAAGPVVKVTPPPAHQPDVNFRPNENAVFLREATATIVRIAAPAARPDAPQVANVVIVPSNTPTTSIDLL